MQVNFESSVKTHNFRMHNHSTHGPQMPADFRVVDPLWYPGLGSSTVSGHSYDHGTTSVDAHARVFYFGTFTGPVVAQ